MLAEIKTDCSLIDEELDRQFVSSQLSPEAQRHLDECERCRALYSCLGEPLPAGAGPHEVEQRIVQTLRVTLRPVSRLRSTAAIAAQLMLVFLLISAAVTSRMKIAGVEVMSVPQLIGISAILSLGAMLLAVSLAWQMRPGSLRRIPEWASVGILAAGLLAGMVLLFPWKTPDAFVVRGWHCLRAGLALAVPVAFVFWLLARRGAPLGLRVLGGTLGAIAGLLSVTVLQYTCDFQEIGHLVVWHGGVLVVSTLAGALIAEGLSRVQLHFR